MTSGETTVTFSAGSTSEAQTIMLTPDADVEGIEYFQVEITTVGGMNSNRGAVDNTLNSANVFILDLSCEHILT